MEIPHSLQESKVMLNSLRERWKKYRTQILRQCEDSGKHDTSKGEFFHVLGKMNVGGLVVSCCQVGVRVAGRCPNCNLHYERDPTGDEMRTQKYKQMVDGLTDRERLNRIYNTPISSS